MSDFRIVLSEIKDVEPSALAESILRTHGENYDAARGDFTVETSDDGVVTITVLEVGGGDIDILANDIESDEDGRFNLRMSQRQGTQWFTRDEGDDDLDG